MEQAIDIQKGQNAMILNESGHCFDENSICEFVSSEIPRERVWYTFKGYHKDTGKIVTQCLYREDFQLI